MAQSVAIGLDAFTVVCRAREVSARSGSPFIPILCPLHSPSPIARRNRQTMYVAEGFPNPIAYASHRYVESATCTLTKLNGVVVPYKARAQTLEAAPG